RAPGPCQSFRENTAVPATAVTGGIPASQRTSAPENRSLPLVVPSVTMGGPVLGMAPAIARCAALTPPPDTLVTTQRRAAGRTVGGHQRSSALVGRSFAETSRAATPPAMRPVVTTDVGP